MGRAWCVVALIAFERISSAQPDPVPTSAPAPAPQLSPQYVPPPPIISTQRVEPEPPPERTGVLLLGGTAYIDSKSSAFAVAYLPLPLPAAPRFKLGLTGGIEYHQVVLLGEADWIMWAYTIVPLAQYDWRLPIESRRGRFLLAVEGGPSFGQIWVRPPEGPHMPPNWQSTTYYAAHAAVAVQFQMNNGLLLSLQPIGVTVPFLRDESSSDFARTRAQYEVAVGVGYRFR